MNTTEHVHNGLLSAATALPPQPPSGPPEQVDLSALGTTAGKTPPEIRNIPLGQIRVMNNQPRTFVDQSKVHDLAEAILAVGQSQAGKVRPIDPPDSEGHCWELISGERRYRACLESNIGFFRAEIDRRPMTPGQQFIEALTCNSDQEPLSPTENALAIQRLKAMGVPDAKICNILSQKIGWVNRHYNLLKLAPPVFAMMRPEIPEEERLGPAVAQLLVPVPPDYQIALAKDIVSRKLTLVQARHQIDASLRSSGGRRPHRKRGHQFQSFASFVRRTQEQLTMFLDTPAPELRSMLADAACLQERLRAIEVLEEIAAGMPELADEVARVLKLSDADSVRARAAVLDQLKSLVADFPRLKAKLEAELATAETSAHVE